MFFWTCHNLPEFEKSKCLFLNVREPKVLLAEKAWKKTRRQLVLMPGFWEGLKISRRVSWRNHPGKCTINCSLKPISLLLKVKRDQFAGHYFRAWSEAISSLLLWKPKRVFKRSRKLTFLDMVQEYWPRSLWSGYCNAWSRILCASKLDPLSRLRSSNDENDEVMLNVSIWKLFLRTASKRY